MRLADSNPDYRQRPYICRACHHALVLHEYDDENQVAACCVEGCTCGHTDLADSNPSKRRDVSEPGTDDRMSSSGHSEQAPEYVPAVSPPGSLTSLADSNPSFRRIT